MLNRTVIVSGVVTGIATALLAWDASAFEYDVSAQLTSEYTSNTRRSENNEDDEFIFAPGASVSASHDGPNLQLDGGYTFERRIYTEDYFDDQNAIVGDASLLWHVLPERLDVRASNVRTETTRSARGAFTEDNRQVTSISRAGPILRFRVRGTDELQAEYNYVSINENRARTDSEEHMLAARYIFALSSSSSLTAEYRDRNIEYDSGFIPEIDATTQFLEYSLSRDALQFRLRGGYTEFERDGQDDVNGTIGELDATWSIGAVTSLFVSGSHNITDRSANLETGRVDFGRPVFEETNTADIFTQTLGEVGVNRRFGATTGSLSVFYTEDDYELTPNDRERRGIRISADRQINPRTSLGAYGEFGTDEFVDDGVEVDEMDLGIRLSWQPGRTLTFEFDVEYHDADGAGTLRSYNEWATIATVIYRPLAR